MHLEADELIDLAEGARPESSAPHLAACAQCRAQLADLRAVVASVADVELPEPSPLFWDHFSRRVHDAVAAETIDGPRSLASRLLGSRVLQASLVAFASLMLVVMATTRTRAPGVRAPRANATEPQAAAMRDRFVDSPIESDASLSLVATLAANADADLAGDGGLARIGSADHAVAHMSDDELRELHRLLQEELAP